MSGNDQMTDNAEQRELRDSLSGVAMPERPLADHDVAAPGSPGVALDTVVLTALRRLPARQREVIVLRVFLDLDIETTARYLAIAPGTVRAHLSRAVTALRNELANANTTEADPCPATTR